MIDRIPSGFDWFVVPFLLGMGFVLGYCILGVMRIFYQLSMGERKKLILSLMNPKMVYKDIRDILLDSLLHVRLWKRNRMLGYMHSSIAFGWFMLIVLGHIEVLLFFPQRLHYLYYPIFFNYFVAETESSLIHSVMFFLMDFFLLIVLSGIALAMYKRVHSLFFGMRRTAQPSLLNRIGLYALWAIFPLRLLAESFIAHLSGGSFLILPANWIIRFLFGDNPNALAFWWVYSIVLAIFLFVLPFSRYMHIPAEMFLIPLRNAGIKLSNARRGFAKVQVLSCPNCGVCIDACPMSVDKANIKDATVYLTRQLRCGNEERIKEISDKCLLCGKCHTVCQVGVDGAEMRVLVRAERKYDIAPDYSSVNSDELIRPEGSVLYYSGCMSKLVPTIGKSMESIFRSAGVDYNWMDREYGMCCGRPMYMAGRIKEAEQIVRKNEKAILNHGAKTLVVSCAICYRMFKEKYNLPGIRVVHYVDYIEELLTSGKLKLDRSDICYVYHDPCELGRGCGIYEAPRRLLGKIAGIAEAEKNRAESICCGGSLGSISLNFAKREKITRSSLMNLYTSNADAIATACPLCQTTFARYADRPVWDIAEIVESLIKK